MLFYFGRVLAALPRFVESLEIEISNLVGAKPAGVEKVGTRKQECFSLGIQ